MDIEEDNPFRIGTYDGQSSAGRARPASSASGPSPGSSSSGLGESAASAEYERILDGLEEALDSDDDTIVEAWYAELASFLSRNGHLVSCSLPLQRWPLQRREELQARFARRVPMKTRETRRKVHEKINACLV